MAFSNANKPAFRVEYVTPSLASQNNANTSCYSLIKQTTNLTGKYSASYLTSPSTPIVPLATNALAKSNTASTVTHSKAFTGLKSGQTYGFLVWPIASGNRLRHPATICRWIEMHSASNYPVTYLLLALGVCCEYLANMSCRRIDSVNQPILNNLSSRAHPSNN